MLSFSTDEPDTPIAPISTPSLSTIGSPPGDDARETVRLPLSATVAIVLAVGFTLLVGVAPGWIISAAENATTIARTGIT